MGSICNEKENKNEILTKKAIETQDINSSKTGRVLTSFGLLWVKPKSYTIFTFMRNGCKSDSLKC